MRYLANPKRDDPHLILPSVQSVICVGLVYNAPLPYSTEVGKKSPVVSGQSSVAENSKLKGTDIERRTTDHGPLTTDNGGAPACAWISRYAWGQDYHEVMRARLEALRAVVAELAPSAETRVYVDTGPIVERAFARLSGIGWAAKNTCLINERQGSWFFLGVMLTSLALEPDLPAPDRCGSCTVCLEACPTGALIEPYVMDASRCIAYFNIELKGSIPEEFRPAIGMNVFGCDICQDVCPWNSKGSRQLSVLSSQSETETRSQEAEDRRQNEKRPLPVVSGQLQPASDQLSAVSRKSRRKAATTTQREFQPLWIEKRKQPSAVLQRTEGNGQLTPNAGRPTSDSGLRTTNNEQLTMDPGPRTTDHGQLTTDNGPPAGERVSSFEFRVSNSRFPFSSFQFPVSLFHPPLEALALLSEDDFRRLFAHSPLKRVKYRGWLRNLCVAMGNSGDRRFVRWLERAVQHPDPIVREHATWALQRLSRE
ncbi:MAG: tRNA epoxyqueuosine(34) reductase QueG [Acidobacteriia bacterium]|nr:tRNA epoxyqueuosine(34) reductase QueG [Terriglobia bacterium]